jgi:DNA invertase Pin-like site-specific DNA recombinase
VVDKQEALERFRRRVADAVSQLEIDLVPSLNTEPNAGRGGRPRARFPREEVAALREQGASWRQIAQSFGVGITTVRRAYKTPG